MDKYSTDFKVWMNERGLTPSSISPAINKSVGTIKNWRSHGIPKRESVRAHITSFMKTYDEERIKSLVDLERFTLEVPTNQFDSWSESALAKGQTLKSWAISALDAMADDNLSLSGNIARQIEKNDPEESDSMEIVTFDLPFLGAVAAGQPISAPQDEVLTASKDYGSGHFVVEINGQSAEPEFMDGDRWVIRAVESGTPKQGKPCIVSDGSGSYLKKWNRKKEVFESINSGFNDVVPSEEAKLQGYPVEKLS